MATIKAYTDFSQSKVLAEILPLESADMRYHTISHYDPNPSYEIVYTVEFGRASGKDVPCWSLSSLLNVLPASCDEGQHCLALINSNPNGDTEWLCCYEDCKGHLMMECYADNQIDACYEMIHKLYEQKLL